MVQPIDRHFHTPSKVTTPPGPRTFACGRALAPLLRCRSQEFAKSGGFITVRHSRVRPTFHSAQCGLSTCHQPTMAGHEQKQTSNDGDDHEKDFHFGACSPVSPERNGDAGQRGCW